jgi:hypothetical protein
VKLTTTQVRILREVSRYDSRKIGGDGQAGDHSSAESLVRRGLLNRWRSSTYAITPAGRAELIAMQVIEAKPKEAQ